MQLLLPPRGQSINFCSCRIPRLILLLLLKQAIITVFQSIIKSLAIRVFRGSLWDSLLALIFLLSRFCFVQPSILPQRFGVQLPVLLLCRIVDPRALLLAVGRHDGVGFPACIRLVPNLKKELILVLRVLGFAVDLFHQISLGHDFDWVLWVARETIVTANHIYLYVIIRSSVGSSQGLLQNFLLCQKFLLDFLSFRLEDSMLVLLNILDHSFDDELEKSMTPEKWPLLIRCLAEQIPDYFISLFFGIRLHELRQGLFKLELV